VICTRTGDYRSGWTRAYRAHFYGGWTVAEKVSRKEIAVERDSDKSIALKSIAACLGISTGAVDDLVDKLIEGTKK
jgi:hypothetical protein